MKKRYTFKEVDKLLKDKKGLCLCKSNNEKEMRYYVLGKPFNHYDTLIEVVKRFKLDENK